MQLCAINRRWSQFRRVFANLTVNGCPYGQFGGCHLFTPCNGGLSIRDECVHTGSRPPATGLRRKILTLLPDMTDPLILDFDGVQSASSSFLDELLGRLAQELGIAAFRYRIRITNAPDRIRGMADVVIKQRLETNTLPDDGDEEREAFF
jgi:hypothetical protein